MSDLRRSILDALWPLCTRVNSQSRQNWDAELCGLALDATVFEAFCIFACLLPSLLSPSLSHFLLPF